MHNSLVKPLSRKRARNRGDCESATPSCKRFLLGELIGRRIVLAWSSKGLQALDARIVDETANTFVVSTASGEKVILKKGNVFLFPENGCKVNGELLLCKPEDRTKKLSKKL